MYKLLMLFMLLVLSFGLTGCNDGGNQNTYELGQTIVLTLESNATTGYGWQLAGPVDGKVVEFVSDNYIVSQTNLVGVGGVEEWAFKAIGKGKTKIKLKYVRPWEKNQAPVKKDVFNIYVK